MIALKAIQGKDGDRDESFFSSKEEMNSKDKNIAYKKIARFIDKGFYSKF